MSWDVFTGSPLSSVSEGFEADVESLTDVLGDGSGLAVPRKSSKPPTNGRVSTAGHDTRARQLTIKGCGAVAMVRRTVGKSLLTDKACVRIRSIAGVHSSYPSGFAKYGWAVIETLSLPVFDGAAAAVVVLIPVLFLT